MDVAGHRGGGGGGGARYVVQRRDATDREGWGEVDDEPCFVVALEVLDNLPHDRVVRVRFERGGGGGEGRWLQTRVVPTPPSSSSSRKAFTEVLEPMTDALLTRTTAAIFGSGGGGETAPRTLPFARRASLGPRVWFGLTRGGMQLHQSRELRITDARLSTLDPSQAAAGSPAPSSASSAASSPPPSLSLSLSRARVGTSSTSPRARWRFSRRCTPRGRTIDSSPRTSILFPRRRSRASARRWSRRRRVLLPSFLAPVLARPRSRLRRSPREGRTGLYLPGRAGVSLRPRPLGFDRHRRAATPASRLD